MKKQGFIGILGGSGFVGSELSAQLSREGYAIKLFTRDINACRHLKVLPTLSIIQINNYSTEELKPHLLNCTALINLIGILNESGRDGSGFHKAHIEVTRTALTACEQAGVSRFLQMSALNADAKGPSHYLRTKGKAETYLNTFAAPLVDVTIFKPSVIFGKNDSFLNRFAGLLKWTPGVFPIACGQTKFAPVYVGDVVQNMVAAINDPGTHGKSYELCGPQIFTLKELVQFTADMCGYRIKVIGLPKFLSKLQAMLLEFVPGKPFSIDNYNSMRRDSICTQGVNCETSLDVIAPTYLGK